MSVFKFWIVGMQSWSHHGFSQPLNTDAQTVAATHVLISSATCLFCFSSLFIVTNCHKYFLFLSSSACSFFIKWNFHACTFPDTEHVENKPKVTLTYLCCGLNFCPSDCHFHSSQWAPKGCRHWSCQFNCNQVWLEASRYLDNKWYQPRIQGKHND